VFNFDNALGKVCQINLLPGVKEREKIDLTAKFTWLLNREK
jgi:hypothetical protein